MFLGPGVYIEDNNQDDIDRMTRMLTGMSPNLIVQLAQQANVSHFYIDDEKLELTFDDNIMTGDITQRMQWSCDLSAQILRELGIS